MMMRDFLFTFKKSAVTKNILKNTGLSHDEVLLVHVYWIEPLTLDQRVAGLIPVNAWHFYLSARHFIHPVCINGYPVGYKIMCRLMWHMCAPKVVPGQYAPQGVEKVHYKCGIDIDSSDQDNNIL